MSVRTCEGPFDNHLLYKSLYIRAPPSNNSKCNKKLLNLSDSFISLFIIAPLVIFYWRGTWCWMDLYPNIYPAMNCFIIGAIIHCCFCMLRELLHAKYNFLRNFTKLSAIGSFHMFVLRNLYVYVFSVGCIMHWRGGWAVATQYLGPGVQPAIILSIICFIPLVLMRSVRNLVAPPILIITDSKEFAFNFPTRYRIDLIDKYTARDTMTVISITILAILALMALKTLRNVTAPPFVVVTDTSNEYFDIPTMYKKSGTREPGLYIFDCLFSVLVIGSLVVFVWRGLWVLLDSKLFPEDVTKSAWASLIIGYAIVGLTFSLQPVMKWACERLEGFWRVIVADVFLFVSFVGTVNVWRGIWSLLDIYFLPDNKLLSDWITHGVSLVLLILLNCSNSVLVRGVYIDAEEPAGQCVIFPVYYIRLFFQKERTKKQKRLSEQKVFDKNDQNNTVLLIENAQMNHSTSGDIKVNNKIINISDDLKLTKNEFSESEHKSSSSNSDEHKVIMCDNNNE